MAVTDSLDKGLSQDAFASASHRIYMHALWTYGPAGTQAFIPAHGWLAERTGREQGKGPEFGLSVLLLRMLYTYTWISLTFAFLQALTGFWWLDLYRNNRGVDGTRSVQLWIFTYHINQPLMSVIYIQPELLTISPLNLSSRRIYSPIPRIMHPSE